MLMMMMRMTLTGNYCACSVSIVCSEATVSC